MRKNRRNGTELIPVEKRKRVIKIEDGRRGRSARRRRKSGIKMVGYAVCVLLILLVVSVGAAYILLQSHASKVQDLANNAMLELYEVEDGTYELSWLSLADSGVDVYYVNVSTYILGSESDQKTLFNGYVDGVSCSLSELPTDGEVVLQIDLIKKYSVFGQEYTWKQASIERLFYIQDSVIKNLN